MPFHCDRYKAVVYPPLWVKFIWIQIIFQDGCIIQIVWNPGCVPPHSQFWMSKINYQRNTLLLNISSSKYIMNFVAWYLEIVNFNSALHRAVWVLHTTLQLVGSWIYAVSHQKVTIYRATFSMRCNGISLLSHKMTWWCHSQVMKCVLGLSRILMCLQPR